MTQPCGGVVVFDYAAWVSQYPEFASVSALQAQSFFNRVTIGGMVDNTPSSVIQDTFERTILLNLAVSHMAFLFAPGPDGKPRGAVGRVSAATEGSVNATLEYSVPATPTEAWWNQSPYGAEYYASTLRYRTATYFPPPRRPILDGSLSPFFRRR